MGVGDDCPLLSILSQRYLEYEGSENMSEIRLIRAHIFSSILTSKKKKLTLSPSDVSVCGPGFCWRGVVGFVVFFIRYFLIFHCGEY